LAAISLAQAEAGQRDLAKATAEQAETIALSSSYPNDQAGALASVAKAFAAAGQLQKAETVAKSIANANLSAHALAGVVEVLAAAGQYRQAETIVRTIPDSALQVKALAGISQALGSERTSCRVLPGSLPWTDIISGQKRSPAQSTTPSGGHVR
jgi:hypothetical protein